MFNNKKRENMEKKLRNFEENYAELIEFCKRERRLPRSEFGKEEGRLKSFMKRYKDDPRIIEIKERYFKNKSFDENYKDLVEFCKRESRLPCIRYGKGEIRLVGFISNYKNDPRIIGIRKEYSRKGKNFDENYAELVEFCKRENRLPQSKFGKEESRLSSFMKNYKNDPKIIKIREYYRSKSHFGRRKSKFEENLKDLIEFCEREDRLPHATYGKEGDSRLGSFIRRYRDDPRIIEIKERYIRNKSFDENLQDLIEFCERGNGLPNRRIENGRLMGFMKRHKEDPRIIAIKKKYSKRGA